MKLKTFNEETLPKMHGGAKSTTPRVSFNKTGTIGFNGPAMELMELAPGDKISIAQDEEDTANWYLFKDSKGFALRGKGDDGKGLTFNHTTLVKKFTEANDCDENITIKCIVAGKPTIVGKVKYWGLLVQPSV